MGAGALAREPAAAENPRPSQAWTGRPQVSRWPTMFHLSSRAEQDRSQANDPAKSRACPERSRRGPRVCRHRATACRGVLSANQVRPRFG